MKFGLFSILPAPEFRSVHQVYEDEMRLLRAADGLGYDSVWLAEHHFTRWGVCPAPPVLAAAIAATTQRVRIGTAISLLPFHDPVKLAEQLAVLDQVSGGRVNVGIGRGGWAKEYETFAVPQEETRARVDEGLDIMRKCWTEDGFSYDGQFRSVRELTVFPKPRQKPHPPLFMATNSRDSTAIAAREGMATMTGLFIGWEQLRENMDVFVPAATAAGHDEATARALHGECWAQRCVYVAESEDAAIRDPEPYLMGFYRELAKRHRSRKSGFDITFEKPYEYYLKDGSTFFGTPDQVVEQITAFREQTRCPNVLCYMSFAGFDADKVQRSMELFAAEVAPRLAPL